MTITDIIAAYYPALSEITPAQLSDARSRLLTFLQPAVPTLDMRPNSVFGDLNLTALTYHFAALEIAISRLTSDLQLENVANNIIWNCDFVSAYLKNFAVSEQATLQSSGVVRLTFNADTSLDIDRGTAVQFGSDTFHLRLPHPGPLSIRAVGLPLIAGTNARNLVDTTNSTWIVDVPVVGVMTTLVAAGSVGALSTQISSLVSVEALQDFSFGLPPTRLPDLAKKAITTAYAATLSTPGGARAFLTREFPELFGTSAVTSGGAEMIRDTVNPLGLVDGRMDLYVKSTGYTFSETALVRLDYDSGTERFVGVLSLPQIPYKIDSIVATGATGVNLTPVILSQSLSPTKAPCASAAYTKHEKLWIVLDMPTSNADGSALIPLDTDTNGDQSALFQVTYRADPLLPAVIDFVESPDNVPPGLDILVRGFVPIVIDSLQIRYARTAGTTFLKDNALQEILAFLQTRAYPAIYTDAKIYDSMYYAGAQDVLEIVCRAHVQWSVAHAFLPYGATTPDTDSDAALAAAIYPHPITIISTKGLSPIYRDANLGTDHPTYEAIGARNTTLVIDAANVSFNEVLL